MKMPKLKTILLAPVILFITAYIAMEVAVRGEEFSNGDKLSTWRITRYSDAYE